MEENKIIEETTVQTADIDDTQFDETTKVDCENNSKSKWERRATKKRLYDFIGHCFDDNRDWFKRDFGLCVWHCNNKCKETSQR